MPDEAPVTTQVESGDGGGNAIGPGGAYAYNRSHVLGGSIRRSVRRSGGAPAPDGGARGVDAGRTESRLGRQRDQAGGRHDGRRRAAFEPAGKRGAAGGRPALSDRPDLPRGSDARA